MRAAAEELFHMVGAGCSSCHAGEKLVRAASARGMTVAAALAAHFEPEADIGTKLFLIPIAMDSPSQCAPQ